MYSAQHMVMTSVSATILHRHYEGHEIYIQNRHYEGHEIYIQNRHYEGHEIYIQSKVTLKLSASS